MDDSSKGFRSKINRFTIVPKEKPSAPDTAAQDLSKETLGKLSLIVEGYAIGSGERKKEDLSILLKTADVPSLQKYFREQIAIAKKIMGDDSQYDSLRDTARRGIFAMQMMSDDLEQMKSSGWTKQ